MTANVRATRFIIRGLTALIVAGVIALAPASCAGFTASDRPGLADGIYANIVTEKGDILIELDFRNMPQTVRNFVGLAEGTLDATGGKPWYDGLAFHRVERGLLIQGGDPRGDGKGDAGYTFANELNAFGDYSTPGILGMSNRGPGTNSCQFFITLAPLKLDPDQFPPLRQGSIGLRRRIQAFAGRRNDPRHRVQDR
jgi:peptidylprolyl isomerase